MKAYLLIHDDTNPNRFYLNFNDSIDNNEDCRQLTAESESNYTFQINGYLKKSEFESLKDYLSNLECISSKRLSINQDADGNWYFDIPSNKNNTVLINNTDKKKKSRFFDCAGTYTYICSGVTVYIGQSKTSMCSRIGKHPGECDWVYDYISFSPIKDNQKTLTIEALLINSHKIIHGSLPKYNRNSGILPDQFSFIKEVA